MEFQQAVVIPLYGKTSKLLAEQIADYRENNLLIVLVNNNLDDIDSIKIFAHVVVNNKNKFGLAGGLNAGVKAAEDLGAEVITFLDQDSSIKVEDLLSLGKYVHHFTLSAPVVAGPQIFDADRRIMHTSSKNNPRILITSGTTFGLSTWQLVGDLLNWMEIDYIDHEWCSRAIFKGVSLRMYNKVILAQTFGERHTNYLAHLLGLQNYSPYRKSIAIRNLRWLIFQAYIPIDIRLKELVKMCIKPWVWMLLEPNKKQTLKIVWYGLNSPLRREFPREHLEK